jgi:hypothetical protein
MGCHIGALNMALPPAALIDVNYGGDVLTLILATGRPSDLV